MIGAKKNGASEQPRNFQLETGSNIAFGRRKPKAPRAGCGSTALAGGTTVVMWSLTHKAAVPTALFEHGVRFVCFEINT